MDICASATFTAEPIERPLTYWLGELGHSANLGFAPYNQVFQTLLDSQGIFARNTDGLNIILLRWQDVGHFSKMEDNGQSLIATLENARFPRPLIVVSCLSSPIFLSSGLGPVVERLDSRLCETVAKTSNISAVIPADLSTLYPVEDYFSEVSDELAHIPFTDSYFTALGTVLARRLDLVKRSPSKVVVVDLDNTLWAGVVGEDGPEGVSIEEKHRYLQEFLLRQRSQGKLLVIASKNNEEDAWEVFRRSEMVLRPEHFAAHRINWEPKSNNLAAMADELSLGLESFVFIDDSSKEVAEVEAKLPQVRTLLLPEQASAMRERLQHFWPFDQAKVTEEDLLRNESYLQEKQRTQIVAAATTIEEFTASLGLEVFIEDLQPEKLPRVSQLTLRTNQFNTTTIRRSEAELQSLLADGTMKCVTVAARDRFGDYGNVGAVLYSFVQDQLSVGSFLLSCRALGRGVEHEIVRYLGKLAEQKGLREVTMNFRPTKKNLPALRFLESLPVTRSSGETHDVFALSAAEAAQISFRAVDYGLTTRESQPADESNAPGFNRYRWIAEERNTVSKIVAAVGEKLGALNKAPEVDSSASRAGARNDVEAKLLKIWADTLNLPQVGIHDDFFELGGDSFMGVDLLMRVIEEFGADHLTLSSIIEAPTVVRFAKLVETKDNHFSCLVPLRSTGSRPIFFLVPGAGGNVLSLSQYLQFLPQEQPIWCLQAPGLDGSEPAKTVHEIAALHTTAIRNLQPAGPYYLGGASHGGTIALEIAQQLLSAGEEVRLLFMQDTYNLAFGRSLSRLVALYYNVRFTGRRLTLHAKKFASLSMRDWPAQVANGWRSLCVHFGKLLHIASRGAENYTVKRAEGPKLADGQQKTELVNTLERVRDSVQSAVEAYVPSTYPGQIVLFRATERAVEPYEDDLLGWGPVANGGVVCRVFEGDHVYMHRNPEFGAQLVKLLTDLQESHSSRR